MKTVFGSFLLAPSGEPMPWYEKARMDRGRLPARACIGERPSHRRGQTERVAQLARR
jgi:hypothetical protein